MIKEIKNFQLKPVSLAVILLMSANLNQAFAYTNGNAGTTSNINKSNGTTAQATNCIVDINDNNVVCGNNATANQNNSVVIGEYAQSSGLSDDASNPEKKGKSNTVAIGVKENATGFEGTSIGSYSKTATRATALGHNAQATGNYSIANGYDASATRNHSIAIGSGASVLSNATNDTNISNNKTVNINGAASESESVGAIALGRKATAAGYGAMAFGLNANSPAAYSHVFGSNSSASRYGSLTLGGYSATNSELGVALGNYSYADRNGGATDAADPLGVGDVSNVNNRSWVSNAGAVSVGSATKRNYAASVDIPETSRQIINVAAGSQDSDAVNVAQLKAAGYKLNAQNDGGQVTINTSDANGNQLTSTNDNKIQNGEELITGAGKNIHLTQTGNHLSIATKDDVNFSSVEITNGAKLDANGIDMKNKTISNLKNGVNDNDAVNVSQLNEVKNNLGVTNTNIQNLSNQTWKLQVNNDNATNQAVKSSDTVNINSGNNINVSKTYNAASNMYNINIATSDNVSFISSNVGGIKTNVNGIDMNAQTISNLKDGVNDNDAVNVSQLNAVKTTVLNHDNRIINLENNLGATNANIQNLSNQTWKLQVNNDNTTNNAIKSSDTVNINSGNNINVSKTYDTASNTYNINIATSDNVSFTSTNVGGVKTTANGIDMNAQTISNLKDGADDNDAVNVRQLNEVKNNLGITNTNIQNLSNQTWKLQVNNDNTTNNAVKSSDTININSGNNINVLKTYDVASNTYNINIATSDNVSFTSTNVGGVKTTANGIDMNAQTISNLKDGVNDNDAVNVRQLNAAKNTVSAGSNIQVSQTQNSNGSTNYVISTNSLITSSGNTQVTDNGVKIGNVTISNTGIDNASNKIVNVQDGEVSATSKEAINGSQLYNAINNMSGNVLSAMDNRVNALGNRIEQISDENKDGTATAMAVAGLTQAYLPGKNMISMAGSVYQGHTGYAIGLSSISDNGNWIVKGTVSGSTRKGRIGATAGFGYQW